MTHAAYADAAVGTYEEMARRYIELVWDKNDAATEAELLAPDWVDHMPLPGCPPGPAGHRAAGPLAARTPGAGACQVGKRRALVEEDEALGRDAGGRLTPVLALLPDLGLVPLGGAQRLRFCA